MVDRNSFIKKREREKKKKEFGWFEPCSQRCHAPEKRRL